ncbi:MAG: hypothetical protein CVU95_05975 [Firmicutes bacterium HGW-Firmicutes-2]|jgi:diguanylate cyclase (GGDEF)-like protein|nr:MAG: hypothetical protein CVU95_05975 [Firmicutes bacterium HGW-Firmicutes-2]
MIKKYKQTIKQEFFFIGFSSALIIAFVFILLASVGIYLLSMDNAQKKLEMANLHISTYTNGVLESLVMSTKTNAAFPGAMDYEQGYAEAEEKLLQLFSATTQANPNIKYSFAGYEDGTLLIEGYETPVGFDARLRPWYASAVERYPRLSVGLPYQDALTYEWLVSVSLAMFDEQGDLKGVMAVDCSLEYIKSIMTEVSYYDSQMNYVLDENRVVFVHNNSNYLHQSVDTIVPGLSEKFSEDSGFIRYKIDGKDRLAFYHRLEEADWIIVSAIDASEVLGPIVRTVSYIMLALVLLAIVLGLGQVKVYERRFVKPITALRDHISDITSGHKIRTEHPYIYSNNELANIAGKIEEMAETSLRKKNDELRLILDATSDGILVLDLEGNIIHTNEKYSKFKDHLLKIQVDQPYNYEQLFRREETFEVLHINGKMVLEQYTCPVFNNGDLKGQLWRYRDITEKFRAEEDLKWLATTDSLTGLWNRRYFLERGEIEVEAVLRTGLPLSLLYIDIDFFKSINDSFGHRIGDEVLLYIGMTLKSQVRNMDVVARLGGEEFCVLAPNTSLQSANLLAEKLRRFFETNIYQQEEKKVHFTISVGVATYTEDIGSIEDLLVAADAACYQAKNQGRNSVVTSDMFR